MSKRNKQKSSNLDRDGRTPAQQRALKEMLGHIAGREGHMPRKRVKALRHAGDLTRKQARELGNLSGDRS